MAQTSYAEQAAAFAGMKSRAYNDEIKSMVQGEASAEMAFGIIVGMSTAGGTTGTPDKCILLADVNTVPMGIVVHSHDYAKDVDLGTTGIKPKALVSVMRRGWIWCVAEDAMAKNSTPFARHTANGGNTTKGALRSDVDTANALKMRGVLVETASAGAGLVEVTCDFLTERALRGVTGY